MNIKQPYRLIISGGGTGGHIFPAVSIANKFKERHPNAEILFVGAKGRMEMVRVPEAGYAIIGLWISGLQRKLTLSNLLFPFKLISSYWKANSIIKRFKPNVVIGTGGYASGPIMLAATRRKIPSLIQEQNSYAGLTNKQLAGKVQRVCVAYAGMEKYFPKETLLLTGNPVRKDLLDINSKRERALAYFAFNSDERTLLVLGGSLGARTINESMLSNIDKLIDTPVQVIWQTGKHYFEQIKAQTNGKVLRKIRIHDFIQHMDMAYAAADVVISRSGALAISELCLAKKPSILVPSPNVAEDHQTKNAMALVHENAALLVSDAQANDELVPTALKLLFDEQKCNELSKNISALAKPNATEEIVDEIEKLITG
ncbi:MAG: UDP-N-acetylglucosamine--N-acetylmuramyl-(pentapeptide) pyrophosphoryl-undecaprenol N-acetylglucosamine transferase [Cytophagales bacterium]|nr:undecaprenyldiphospho-muramoylpentapeptide beta-N-acetylglucosaminyltransferase [Bacteroidota bacterium]MBS1980627.1 undecaprenyldiphospho-muramoylpentapeptide beta-N-acetylglucosaminyltransferase [Bacteroidota bacterium]WHZ07950.1 MAG: UDP-N-acetylglucosamine--N-acetylmuramyl-(pentapeptide) pyrophosphoryl-undecaprenol N-acetylglucosamine transferase [Cytophagales bacterium]